MGKIIQHRKHATCYKFPFTWPLETVVLGTDGTRAVEDILDDERPATVLSILDHYRTHPTTSDYNDLTLYQFAKDFMVSKNDSESKRTNKAVV